MLNGALSLYDIRDVEAFCNAALEQTLRRWHAPFTPADREDALAYLISETWRISTRYDAHITPSFTAYARPYQTRFLIEFSRRRWLDTRNADRYTHDEWARIQQLIFTTERLDAPINGHIDDGDPRTLGDLLAFPDSSTPTDSDTALARAERESNRFKTRDKSTLCQGLLEEAAA